MNGKPTVRLDKRTGRIMQGGRYLRLPPLEYRLLCHFIKHPDVQLTKSNLIDHVWPDDVLRAGVTDDALYRLIRSARRALAESAPDADYIITWRGQPEGGYFFSPGSSDLDFGPLTLLSPMPNLDDFDPATLHALAKKLQELANSLLVVYGDDNGRFDHVVIQDETQQPTA